MRISFIGCIGLLLTPLLLLLLLTPLPSCRRSSQLSTFLNPLHLPN
jgi:hypothetical protein